MQLTKTKILPVLFFFFLNTQIFGQTLDYKSIRDSLTKLSCGKMDSSTVFNTKIKLETFDTALISSNIAMYYHDLGWCYYRIYGYTKDTSFIAMMSASYDKALSHNPNYGSVLWDKSFIHYFFYNDCQKGKYYMDRYKKVTRKKYWNHEQMKLFAENCEK